MTGPQMLPRAARLLIAGTVFAGLAALAARIPETTRWDGHDLLILAGLVAVLAVLEVFWLPLRHRAEIMYLSLTDAVWMAALILLMLPKGIAAHPSLARPGLLCFAVALGAAVGQAARRRAPVKIAFNVGQFVVSVTLAEVVFTALHPPVTQPQAWADALVAMGLGFAANACLTALVIALVGRKPFLSVLLPPLGPNVLHWAGNMAMGVVMAVLWERARYALPVAVAPMALSYFAYRAWLHGMRERDRMRRLYEAGLALSGSLDEATFAPFLTQVEQLLDAQAAELVVVNGDQVTIHHKDDVRSLVAESGDRRPHEPAAYVRLREGLSPQAAMVGEPGGVRGVLAVYRREELTDSERSLLDALASQVRVRLVNQRLYSETLEQRTQLADIIGHSSDGIFVVSPDELTRSWNPAMEHITGRTADEAIGRSWTEVLGPRERGGRRSDHEDGNVLMVRSDGAERWIHYTRTPITDRTGGMTAHVVVARDITADLEAEQLKADFVATVSHELRTPLTPLKGFLQTLISGTGDDSPATRREFYSIMQKQVNRLEHLISDLLEVSRIEAGRVPVDSRVLDLTALVHEQIGAFRRDAPDRSIELRSPGSPVFVQADPLRIAQVLANLLSNALKYSDEDRPVEVTVASAGDQAIASVRDEGEGIPLSEQERVFERFHRVEGGLTRRTGGTGLGLYIAKRLVEALGGRLWLVSNPGSGSTFSFSLPAAEVPPPASDGATVAFTPARPAP